jgi:hypothetical protein
MFATFEGEIKNGQLLIEEFKGGNRILEGKHIAISSLDLDDENRVVGGNLMAGTFKNGELETLSGSTLKDFDNKKVFVVVRHALIGRHEAFDEKYQLGARIGDVDT